MFAVFCANLSWTGVLYPASGQWLVKNEGVIPSLPGRQNQPRRLREEMKKLRTLFLLSHSQLRDERR
jgi:hypothetical protein